MSFDSEKKEKLKLDIDIILDAIHDDILIADKNGKVVKVSATFESVYGINRKKAVGMSVFEMEEQGFFKPSITAIVLQNGEKVTLRQKNKKNRDIVVTATPINDEKGVLQYVISFSRDITDFLNLQEQYAELEDKVSRYRKELDILRNESFDMEGIIAKSPPMKKLINTINKVALFDANVLLTGESGVGKSLLAQLIHKKSKRNEGPFIDINCGAIPENLLESELFGYERGSFTGAGKDGKVGLIELAQNGTLFLDEISELPINLQVKILKVIQGKTIIRVGGTKEIQVDFRLVAASNKKLQMLMENGEFREDLYYRLNVISMEIPPLRERKEDLIPLIAYFVDKYNKNYGIKKILTKELYEKLSEQKWHGNIRELENTIEKILITSEDDIVDESSIEADKYKPLVSSKDLDGYDINEDRYERAQPLGDCNLNKALEKLEAEIVKTAYEKHKTTVAVAKALGISQPTAFRKIEKYVESEK